MVYFLAKGHIPESSKRSYFIEYDLFLHFDFHEGPQSCRIDKISRARNFARNFFIVFATRTSKFPDPGRFCQSGMFEDPRGNQNAGKGHILPNMTFCCKINHDFFLEYDLLLDSGI